MRLPPLQEGKILRRYKRFLADVELPDGRLVTAHCPNTGSMRGCWEPGAAVQLSQSDNPRRKLAWTLERVDMGRGWIGVHTGRTNPVVAEALKAGRIAQLADYPIVRAEVAYEAAAGSGSSRFDFHLSGKAPEVWVEVKNVTLWDEPCLRFPDAVTERGRRHLEHLAEVRAQGCRAVMIYALNRPEGYCFSPADAVDPAYGRTLRRVVNEAGVEVLALRVRHDENAMTLAESVEVILD